MLEFPRENGMPVIWGREKRRQRGQASKGETRGLMFVCTKSALVLF